MVHREIGGIIEALEKAIMRLSAARTAQNQARVSDAEDDVCLESRTLFARYIDIVLWSGEFDEALFKRVEAAIASSVEAVPKNNSEAAESIRLRATEFKEFAEKHERRWRLKQSDKLVTASESSWAKGR